MLGIRILWWCTIKCESSIADLQTAVLLHHYIARLQILQHKHTIKKAKVPRPAPFQCPIYTIIPPILPLTFYPHLSSPLTPLRLSSHSNITPYPISILPLPHSNTTPYPIPILLPLIPFQYYYPLSHPFQLFHKPYNPTTLRLGLKPHLPTFQCSEHVWSCHIYSLSQTPPLPLPHPHP